MPSRIPKPYPAAKHETGKAQRPHRIRPQAAPEDIGELGPILISELFDTGATNAFTLELHTAPP